MQRSACYNTIKREVPESSCDRIRRNRRGQTNKLSAASDRTAAEKERKISVNKPDVSVRKWDAIYKILDSLFSVAVLPFAIYALFTRGTDDPTKDRLYSAAFFFVFSLSFVCQALRKKNRSEKYTWQLIQAGVYLVSVILILAVPNSSDSLPIITILFAVMMILNRVLSIVKKTHLPEYIL